MKPEIETYLREQGATYTPEALRRALVDAGHDPVEVDAALKDWQAGATNPASAKTDLRRFWRWAFGLHLAVLVAIGILSLVIGSFAGGSWGLLVILAVVLLIGLGISGLVGSGVLRSSGLFVALLMPAISALLIGGTCLALGGSYLLQSPPRTGVMELHIEDPLSFNESGAATCQDFGGTSGFLVSAESLGTLDGSIISVSIDASPSLPVTNLSITLSPKSGTERAVYYSVIFSTRVELDASPDGLSGTFAVRGARARRG
jgi:hypothetical protein